MQADSLPSEPPRKPSLTLILSFSTSLRMLKVENDNVELKCYFFHSTGPCNSEIPDTYFISNISLPEKSLKRKLNNLCVCVCIHTHTIGCMIYFIYIYIKDGIKILKIVVTN